jgi:Helix-turn-helix domain
VTASDAHPATLAPTLAGGPLAPAPGFVCLPRAVLRAPGLSVLARLLYGVLLDYARQDGRCYPGTERLRADLGCGHNQLARAVRELEAGGLVARRRRGFGKTTVYHLLPLPAARPARRALSSQSVETLLGPPRAPRVGRPVRPGPAPQRAPVRGGQDQDPGDRDAADQQQPPRPAPAGGTPGTPEGGGVVALLVEQGVTRRVAEELGGRYPAELVRRQVECHRHRVTASGLTRNPVGALVQAIREDWAPPAAWTAARAGTAVRAVQAEDDRRRREEEEQRRREWAQKPPEERIAGRLQFWLMGQRRKGHEPDAAALAARLAELLAELAARDGAAPVPGIPAPPPPRWDVLR